MRVIKFRGIKQGTSTWVYGDLKHDKGISSTGLYDRLMVGGYPVEDNTVGQFTGLLDKNGKEIYEGDLMQIGTEKAVVVYSANGFYQEVINDDSVYCNFNSYEVIGSIHDNPELLKGGNA